MRYTTDPPNLILPTEATIHHIAKREGLGALSENEFDLVWDLLAKAGDAQVAEFDEEQAQVEAGMYAILEAEAFCQRHPSADKEEAARFFERNFHTMQHRCHELLEALDLNDIPGYNHPVKAVRVVKLLRSAQLMWVLHIISLHVDSLIECIMEAMQRVDALSDADMALLKEFTAGSDHAEDEAEMLGIELQLSGFDLGEVLRISRQLDELSEFQSKHAKPTPSPNGENVRLRDIKDFSELGRVTQQAFTLPSRLRLHRAATGELSVRQPETRRDQKQLLFMVVDGTGSMLADGATSASRAAGVVMNRLKAVIDGEAEVYLRFFDGDLREEEFHANSPESARELMDRVMNPAQYMGMRTEFKSTLAAAGYRVKELVASGKFRAPELVFVTDGHAPVPHESILEGVKMHAVQVGMFEVHDLSSLARQSGGVSVYAGYAQ